MKYSRELKVGIIVLITIVCFWMLFQYLKGNDVFTSGNVFYVDFKNVDGLQPTKAVTINGYKVGKVDDIEPIADNKGNYSYKVKLIIDNDYVFNKGTVAEIYEPGFMSGKEIRLLLSPNPPLAQDGDYLEGKINSSLIDMMSNEVGPLKDNLTNVLNQLDTTLITSQAVMQQVKDGNLRNTLDNANGMMNSFKNTSNKASDLLEKNTQEVNTLLRDANTIMASLDGTLKKYGQVADKVNELEVEKSLQDLSQTLAKLNTFMDKLNSDEGTMGKILTDDKLYNNLNETIESANSLLKDLEENPKRYVNISVFGKK